MAKNAGLTPARDLLPAIVKPDLRPLSPIQARLLETAGQDSGRSALYQHAAFCQICLPNRDPGDDVRVWERQNGNVHLKVLAGEAMHPEKKCLVPLGLPYGPKARLILMHINQQALRQRSPEIEIQSTLTKFVERTLGLAPHGRNMRVVKDQLARLSAASIRLGIVQDGRALTVNTQIVSAFDIWFPKDDRQRVLWPSTIQLSLDYWESLKAHAVPLDEGHIAALSHSSLALDCYTWLAHRLCRVPGNRPAAVSWAALHSQFGQGYGRIDNFRRAFLVALWEVLAVYRAARIKPGEGGLILHSSAPPVSHRAIG